MSIQSQTVKEPEKNVTESSAPTTAIQFNQEEQSFHKHLTLGIEEKLQKNRMIKDIKLIIRQPVDKLSISAWERKNAIHLPSDFKDYYNSTNGFKLTWSLEHAGDNLKIGEMSINSINNFISLESAAPKDTNGPGHEKDSATGNRTVPGGTVKLSSHATDSGKSNGKVLDARKLSTSSISNNSRTNTSAGNGKIDNNSNKTHTNDGDKEFQMYYQELRQTMVANSQVKSQDLGGLVLLPNDKAFILDSNSYGWVCLIYPHASNNNTTKNITNSVIKSENDQINSPQSPGVNVLKKDGMSKPNASTSIVSAVHVEEPSVEIWFLDQSFNWNYLAPTFSNYYRMMLFHLGLPQWQYRFTPFGLSSWAEQIFWLVAPHLLTPPKISKFPSIYHAGGLWSEPREVPSEIATPNPTLNILTNQIFKRKKKEKV